MLQEAVGETAGRGAQVDGDVAMNVQAEMFKGMLEFQASAAPILCARGGLQRIVVFSCIARLFRELPVYTYQPRHDSAPGLFPALIQASLDEFGVEAFHGAERATTGCNADGG